MHNVHHALRDSSGACVDDEVETRMVAGALAREREASARLVAHLTPTIQFNAGRALLAHRRGAAVRNYREEVDDLCQEILVTLFADEGRVLRVWDRSRGASLKTFVATVARRRAGALLSARCHNPWSMVPVEQGHLENVVLGDFDAERRLAARQVLHQALQRTLEGQSDKGRQMAEMLFTKQLDHDEIVAATGMSAASVYQWRSRLTRALKHHVTALINEEGGEPEAPDV